MFLRRRRLDREIAAAAADLAVAGATPLRMNEHKVEIGRTLVERVLVGAIDGNCGLIGRKGVG